MTVADILKQKAPGVETALPEISIAEAARLLTEKGIGSLVVCEARGNPVGILNERDIVKAVSTHGLAIFSLPIRSIMNSCVTTCTPGDQVKHVMSVMTRQRARHMPVIVSGRLVGIVSIGDIVKNRLEQNELEVNVLRDHARMRSVSWIQS